MKRYTVDSEGQKYLQSTMTDFGRTSGFCYGLKQVDAIVKWTEPMTIGGATLTKVIYTYRIVNLAPWATRSDIQQAFPAIAATLNAASKTDQSVELQLLAKGWEVPS